MKVENSSVFAVVDFYLYKCYIKAICTLMDADTGGTIMGISHGSKSEGLNIIIVGCGKVGAALLEQLCKEGHEITIIDKNPQKVQTFTNLYDIMGVVGNGASHSIQKEAGIESADLIIAVTESDELNLLCCTVATQVGNRAAIARVNSPDYNEEVGYLREKLGLALIINPDYEAAKEIARILFLPTALEVSSFAHGQAELVKLSVPEDNYLAGKSIAELSKNIEAKFIICAIEREGEIHIPSGNFTIEKGDKISFVATRKETRKFLKHIGFKTNQVKDTIIIGGGKTAYYLAKQLISMGISVKIIDQDKARCEELSILLPKAIIINGDGTDEELLKEEGITYCESFVPLTGIDEENILLTLHAKNVSEAKVITKINRNTFMNVIDNLDLDSVIYPKYITCEAIIAYVRAKKNSKHSDIETLYHMFNSRVEAIEFRIDESDNVCGVPISELKIKDNIIISFINRNGSIIFPTGKDQIKPGDTVMIVTTHTGFANIQDIFE